jgi:hypothetical protein
MPYATLNRCFKVWGMVLPLLLLLVGPAGAGTSTSPSPSPYYYPAPLPAFLGSPRPAGLPANVTAEHYNNGQRELNLWRIEANKLARSAAALTPQADALAYTEAIYLPGTRQMIGGLYYNALLGSTEALALTAPLGTAAVVASLDPRRLLQQRLTLWRVGDERAQPFAFSTLGVVDWSADGQRLLVKRRHGVTYTGLRPIELAVVERATGAIQVYGETLRAVQAWVGTQPVEAADALRLRAWDLEPLGWQPNSNTVFYYRAWAFSQQKPPAFLGLWSFDTEARFPQLISQTVDKVPIVAANAWWIDPNQAPPAQRQAASTGAWSQRFKRQPSTAKPAPKAQPWWQPWRLPSLKTPATPKAQRGTPVGG